VVESGAYDGLTMSNSLFFETSRHWDCLLVEANPHLQASILAKHRGCHLLKGGLSITDGPSSFPFRLAGALGGFEATYDETRQKRVNKEAAEVARTSKRIDWENRTVTVPCYPLVDIMRTLNRKVIDYWSLDTEGSEVLILEHTDFSAIEVGVISVEWANDPTQRYREVLRSLLERKGMSRVMMGPLDDFYANRKYFDARGLVFPGSSRPPVPSAPFVARKSLSTPLLERSPERSPEPTVAAPADLAVGLGDLSSHLVSPGAPSTIIGYTPGKFYSQIGQDRWVDSVLQGRTGLFVVESGGYDGVTHSNSLFFEASRQWNCLLVEANPHLQRSILEKHRGCHLFKGGLSIADGPSSFPFRVAGPLGGIATAYTPNHLARVNREAEMHKRTTKRIDWEGSTIQVQCYPIADMMKALNRKVIDYWSLDTEGSEAMILQHTDFTAIQVGVMTVEWASDPTEKLRGEIRAVLERNGFSRVKFDNQDDYYANRKYFQDRGLRFPR